MDEEALLEALESGHIGGAALDVLKEECRLIRLPNMIITPYMGMYFYEAINAISMIAAQNAASMMAQLNQGCIPFCLIT